MDESDDLSVENAIFINHLVNAISNEVITELVNVVVQIKVETDYVMAAIASIDVVNHSERVRSVEVNSNVSDDFI